MFIDIHIYFIPCELNIEISAVSVDFWSPFWDKAKIKINKTLIDLYYFTQN